MPAPKSTLIDLDAVARAIGRAKTTQARPAAQWFLSVAKGRQPGIEIVLTIQQQAPGTALTAWVELHFATQADAVRWLATVGAWTFAQQRAVRETGAQQEALLAPLRHALRSLPPMHPTAVWQLHASGPANTVIDRTAIDISDHSDHAFCNW